MRICIFQGELRNESKDEVVYVVQPTTSNDIAINNLLEISQQITLAIHNLLKEVAIIKRNISIKSIIRDDDIDDNE